MERFEEVFLEFDENYKSNSKDKYNCSNCGFYFIVKKYRVPWFLETVAFCPCCGLKFYRMLHGRSIER